MLEINGLGRIGIELCPARSFGNGIVKRSKGINQPQLTGRAAIPDAALRNLLHAGERQLSLRCDKHGEARIDVVNAALNEPVSHGIGAAQDVRLA